MRSRYSVRTPARGKAFIASNGDVLGQGRIQNLSVPGCMLESDLPLHVGQAIQLQLRLSNGTTLNIGLAVVRWIKGCEIGMEFIRMSSPDQAQLRWRVGFHDDLAAPLEPISTAR